MGLLIYFGDKYNIHYSIGIIFIVIILLAASLITSYKINKWRLWAYYHVDDIGELLRRMRGSFLSGKSGLPGKWAIVSAVDRQQLAELLAFRKSGKSYLIDQSDDYSVANETVVFGSRRNYLMMFLVFIAAVPVGMFFRDERLNFAEMYWSRILVFILCILFAIYNLYRYFNPLFLFAISVTGFRDKKHELNWNRIVEIYLDSDVERGTKVEVLNIEYFKGETVLAVKHSLRNSSTNAVKLESIIKAYLARYNTGNKVKLAFGKKY